MKALTTALLLLSASCASVSTSETQSLSVNDQPVAAGISKPGWGAPRQLTPRRHLDVIEAEGGVPEMAHYRGLRKPGTGARR